MGAVDFFAREFQAKRSGLPDLLRYACQIRPGVILGKGGELIASYRYRGPDLQCASEAELARLRLRVNTLIKRLPVGWMLHGTTLRQESVSYEAGGEYPDPVTAAIEREREKQYQAEGAHYENNYVLTFTYLPPPLLVSKIKEFAFDSDDAGRLNPRRIAAKSVDYFERTLSEFIGELESDLGKLIRLKARRRRDPATKRRAWFDDHLSFLHECCSGGIRQPIRLPVEAVPIGIDHLIGSYSFLPGVRPRVGDVFVRVVAIEGLPDSGTHFGILEALNRLPVEFRWTTRWIARDAEKAKADVRKVRSKWRQKVRGFVADMTGRHHGPVNQDAAEMALDAEGVLKDLESGDVAYGQWTSTVILSSLDSSVLEATVQYLLKNVRSMGFTCRDEDVNAVEAFLGSLPGHGYENVRRPEIHSLNLADCLPLSSTWQGPTENPCSFYKKYYRNKPVPPLFHGSAAGGTPFRMVLHNGDVGHTFIVGPTGAGKSTLLGLIAAQHFRYPNAKFFGFEKGESMMALCLAAGGSHYNFLAEDGSESKIGFAPFAQVHRLSDRVWAGDYIETLLRLHDVKVDIDMRAEIDRALELLAKRPMHMRSFTDLGTIIQSREIRQVLSLYEHDLAGGMLNAREDTVTTARFTVFELEQLMEMGDKHIVPVLLYLFRMVERALDGSPTIISLDEAWLALKHPLFADQLKKWLKVLRKANALVIFATQELQDLADSPIRSTIFSACQTKILLPYPDAGSAANAPMYKEIGLTEREIELLSYARPKHDYFFKSPAGRRLFELELGPVALAFVAVSGKEERATVKALYEQYGADWPGHWMRKQGLDSALLGGRFRLAA